MVIDGWILRDAILSKIKPDGEKWVGVPVREEDESRARGNYYES